MPEHLDASALKDKSVIVTGGASGIGLATVNRFAQGGAYVTIADLQQEVGERAAAELAAKGLHVSFVHCDTTNWESSVAAFKHAATFAPGKTIDVAALCAGATGDRHSLAEQALAAPEPSLNVDAIPTRPRRRAIEVNLLGLYDNCWLALYYMRLPSQIQPGATPSKSLIVVSSLAGYMDMPKATDYNAAKFGVRGIFRGLRYTAAAQKVRVNLIAPYYIDTPMVRSVLPALEAQGVGPGKGFSWASIEYVVDAMVRSATDESAGGMAFAVWPEGYADMGDDEDGGWAGEHLKEQFAIRRSKGDYMI